LMTLSPEKIIELGEPHPALLRNILLNTFVDGYNNRKGVHTKFHQNHVKALLLSSCGLDVADVVLEDKYYLKKFCQISTVEEGHPLVKIINSGNVDLQAIVLGNSKLLDVFFKLNQLDILKIAKLQPRFIEEAFAKRPNKKRREMQNPINDELCEVLEIIDTVKTTPHLQYCHKFGSRDYTPSLGTAYLFLSMYFGNENNKKYFVNQDKLFKTMFNVVIEAVSDEALEEAKDDEVMTAKIMQVRSQLRPAFYSKEFINYRLTKKYQMVVNDDDLVKFLTEQEEKAKGYVNVIFQIRNELYETLKKRPQIVTEALEMKLILEKISQVEKDLHEHLQKDLHSKEIFHLGKILETVSIITKELQNYLKNNNYNSQEVVSLIPSLNNVSEVMQLQFNEASKQYFSINKDLEMVYKYQPDLFIKVLKTKKAKDLNNKNESESKDPEQWQKLVDSATKENDGRDLLLGKKTFIFQR